MDQHLPSHLPIKHFCKYVGISNFHFMRVRDRYNVPIVYQGNCKLVEVDATIKMLSHVPGIELMLSNRGNEMMRQLRQAISAE
jgi:hypothetical protein